MAQRLDIARKACGMAEDALTVNPGKSLLVDTHKRNPLYSDPKKRPLVTEWIPMEVTAQMTYEWSHNSIN
jgi:hypothetical protein